MDNPKNIQYKDYLAEHLSGIKKGLNWIKQNAPGLLINDGIDYEVVVHKNIAEHDYSKYTKQEWIPYREYFYGAKTDKVRRDFDYAWLNHIHNNPHHWQYWVLLEDEGKVKPLDIPYEYIIEMFLDHWSFSWKEGNLFEVSNWYNSRKNVIVFSDKTRQLYENILNTVMDILND